MPVTGYIIEYPTGKNISFEYFEDIEDNVEAQYDEGVVRGRSEEHAFYSHTTANTNSFQIRLVASVDESDNRDAKKIWNEYLFVKSFQYPDYGPSRKGPIAPPKKAIITIGSWYRNTGIIKGVQGTLQKPYDEEGYPMIIDVRFTFRIVRAVPASLFDIRAGL